MVLILQLYILYPWKAAYNTMREISIKIPIFVKQNKYDKIGDTFENEFHTFKLK